MPGVHEETWGKAATEAQLNGIPVIAAARGALPETVGPGGMLVPIDQGIGPWLSALDQVTGDAALYRRLSAAALAHARCADWSPATIGDRFIGLLQGRIALAKAAGAVRADTG